MHRRALRWLSTGALVAAALVVVLHLLHVRASTSAPAWLHDEHLALNRDRGLAELLGYAELLVAAGFLVAVHRRAREAVVLAWAAVLLLVLADDSLFLHERVGYQVVARWGVQDAAGLRGSDLGELGAWAVMGLGAAVLLLVSSRRSSRNARRALRPFVLAFAALVFFAVVVDLLDQALGGDGQAVAGIALDPALRVVESGGELLSVTALMLTAARLALPPRAGDAGSSAPGARAAAV